MIHAAKPFFDIIPLTPQNIFAMNNIFIQSVNNSYGYFPDFFKKKLIKQHSVPHLLKAYISPKSYILLARQKNQWLGYCIARQSIDEPSSLLWLYVKPETRGSGLGASLVRQVQSKTTANGISSLQLVTHDQEDFFMSQGFQVVRRVPGLLAGVDMSVMEWSS